MSEPTPKPPAPPRLSQNFFTPTRVLRWLLVLAAAIFFALHFLHLNADFPNNSPWVDWSKYTDEGWYGDAAIRQVLFGHWYFKGDFNPAVALPAFPALEWLLFRITGVSAAAARAFTLCLFAVTLITTWFLLEDRRSPPTHARETDQPGHPHARNSTRPLAAAFAVVLLATSPFLYVFDRMAILEPLLIALTLLALLTASHLHPVSWRTLTRNRYAILPTLTLGLLLPAMVLTKTTAIFLIPAIAYMVWARAGFSLPKALHLSLLPAIMAVALWIAYYLFFVHRYLADYQYLFSANAYTGIELAPFATVILNTVSDGAWMGRTLYLLFFVILALAVFWRPRFFTNPIVPALLLWTGGYFAFLAYHNNLQPRYYLVVAVPITLLVALGLDCFREARGRIPTVITATVAAAAFLAIAIPDSLQTLAFVRNPDYTFRAALQNIAAIVRADKTHPNLVLSISGSDLTLNTGIPSIDDDFGTLDLPARVRAYRPGWYAAWNELDDDKMDALTPLYHIERVASFPAYDDPDRNLLILYRLDPTLITPPLKRTRATTPKPLLTRLGQQPTTQQLQH